MENNGVNEDGEIMYNKFLLTILRSENLDEQLTVKIKKAFRRAGVNIVEIEELPRNRDDKTLMYQFYTDHDLVAKNVYEGYKAEQTYTILEHAKGIIENDKSSGIVIINILLCK